VDDSREAVTQEQADQPTATVALQSTDIDSSDNDDGRGESASDDGDDESASDDGEQTDGNPEGSTGPVQQIDDATSAETPPPVRSNTWFVPLLLLLHHTAFLTHNIW
jgi:hypothetical protein